MFFDGTTHAWSADPPTDVSLAAVCGPGGSHGEVDAYVGSTTEYWLDRVGFQASGSALRVAPLDVSDDAQGTAFACGDGGKVLTQLFCGKDVGTGTLALTFRFDGHWADGSPWSKECPANLAVLR